MVGLCGDDRVGFGCCHYFEDWNIQSGKVADVSLVSVIPASKRDIFRCFLRYSVSLILILSL